MAGTCFKSLEARRCGNISLLDLKKATLRSQCWALTPIKQIASTTKFPTSCMDIDPSGRYLVLGAKFCDLEFFDLEFLDKEAPLQFTSIASYRPTVNKNLGVLQSVQWYPLDPGMFSTSDRNGVIRFWDSNKMLPVESISVKAKVYHHTMCQNLGQRLAGNLVAAASVPNHIYIVDGFNGGSSHELVGHNEDVLCCAWSPVSDYILASGSLDGSVLLWDIRSSRGPYRSLRNPSVSKPYRYIKDKTGKIRPYYGVAHKRGVNGLAFTPDGKCLMTAGLDETVRSWDLHTYKLKNTEFEGIDNERVRHKKIQICGFGKYNLCFIPSGDCIHMFEVESGDTLKTLFGHFSEVNCCYFLPSRMELYTCGRDRTFLIWKNRERIALSADLGDNSTPSQDDDRFSDNDSDE